MPIYLGCPFDGTWKKHNESGPEDKTYYPPHLGGDMVPLSGQLPFVRFIASEDGAPMKAKVMLVSVRPSGAFLWLSPLALYTARPLCTVEFVHLEPGSIGLVRDTIIDSQAIIGTLGKGPFANWSGPNCHFEVQDTGSILKWEARETKAGLTWPGDFIFMGRL